jgi:integrase
MLTVREIHSLEVTGSRYEIADGGGLGLVIRVSATGTKTFAVNLQAGGRRRRITLGTFPHMTLATAREEARKVRKQQAEGSLPDRHLPDVVTVRELADSFERLHLRGLRSGRKQAWVLNRYVVPVLGSLHVQKVTRRHVAALLDDIAGRQGHRVLANRVRALTGQMFRFAVQRGHLEANPVEGTARFKEERTQPVATDQNLRDLFRANGSTLAAALRWQAYTGCRIGEAASMRWADLDIDRMVWSCPPEHHKANRGFAVPFTDGALHQLPPRTSDWVFPGLTGNHINPQSVPAWLKQRGLGFTSHSLRRRVRTALSRLAPWHVAERILGHQVGDATVRAYDQHDYVDEMRVALEAWAAELEALVTVELSRTPAGGR